MKLQTIRDALLTATCHVYHGAAPDDAAAPYIVWAEEGAAGALYGDNGMQGQVVTGTVDYFTRVEFDAAFEKIQCALRAAGIPFRLNSIQFEHDTGLTHYEWVWNIVGEAGGKGR